jgi:hypothetical protein
MATTTNYGWTTPDDTALVKDGASAIRTLGSSVDTTTKALNPSTTLGDIEYRSSTANTNTRLGIGTSGQVLSVSGGVPAWSTISSGGMTLLSTTAASGSTVTISSISQSYKDLIIITQGLNNASAWSTEVRLNATTVFQGVYLGSNGASFSNGRSTSYIDLSPVVPFAGMVAENAHCIVVKNYANTSFYKAVQYFGRNFNSSGAAAMITGGGAMVTSSALSSISVVASAGTFTAGEILIYGVN